ncbi:uncharacterized protein ACRADG_010314 isoform 2-T2 [Cochliomyia hominivorax]
MRILRSQYLKLAERETKTAISDNSEISRANEKFNKTEKGNISFGEIIDTRDLQHGCSVDAINTSRDVVGTNIKLLLENMDESLKDLKIVVEYTSMDSLWLTRIYRTYENDLWHRKIRLNILGKRKWFYYCNLCNSVEYKTYYSIKSHLNGHLKFYPYVCKLCYKKYTNRKMATKHLKSVHKITRLGWNDYLTS